MCYSKTLVPRLDMVSVAWIETARKISTILLSYQMFTCLLWGRENFWRGFRNFPLSCKMRSRATLPLLSPDQHVLVMTIFLVIFLTIIKGVSSIKNIRNIRSMRSTVRSTCASCCSPPSPTHPWSMNTNPCKSKIKLCFWRRLSKYLWDEIFQDYHVFL